MALVDYTSSDEEAEVGNDNHEEIKVVAQTSTKIPADALNSLKRKRDNLASDLPPLPSKFHDLYATNVRSSTTDDSNLHGGRKRVIPHVEGNWPTHIFIEWYPSAAEYQILTSLITRVQSATASNAAGGGNIHSFLTSDLGSALPLHISLSRTLGFSKDVKDVFLSALEQAIKSSGIRPFDVGFSSLGWVPNYEKTRWFLVLRVSKPETDGLNRLLHVSNKVAAEFGQPPLYAQPTPIHAPPKKHTARRNIRNTSLSFEHMQDLSDAFHISIAWALIHPDKEVITATDLAMKDQSTTLKDIQVTAKEIKAKIGNIVTSIPLSKGATEDKSLFGL
ncbi:poly(U)-specific 3'-to-5' RNA exonuclease [Clarireedia jacksonii]